MPTTAARTVRTSARSSSARTPAGKSAGRKTASRKSVDKVPAVTSNSASKRRHYAKGFRDAMGLLESMMPSGAHSSPVVDIGTAEFWGLLLEFRKTVFDTVSVDDRDRLADLYIEDGDWDKASTLLKELILEVGSPLGKVRLMKKLVSCLSSLGKQSEGDVIRGEIERILIAEVGDDIYREIAGFSERQEECERFAPRQLDVGQIVMVDLMDDPHSPRPAVILCRGDKGFVVVPTSTTARMKPYYVRISADCTGDGRNSLAQTDRVQTVAHRRIGSVKGKVSQATLLELKEKTSSFLNRREREALSADDRNQTVKPERVATAGTPSLKKEDKQGEVYRFSPDGSPPVTVVVVYRSHDHYSVTPFTCETDGDAETILLMKSICVQGKYACCSQTMVYPNSAFNQAELVGSLDSADLKAIRRLLHTKTRKKGN